MASLLPPNAAPLLPATISPKHLPTTSQPSPLLLTTQRQKNHRLCSRGGLPPPAVASGSPPHVSADYLSREFSGHGATFEGLGDSCVLRMGLDDGSAATVLLPDGLVTSYKPRQWHGSTTEVLHTSVLEGRDGAAVVRGGLSVGLSCAGGEEEEASSWSPNSWAIRDVRGGSEKAVQVELVSSDPEGTIEIKYVVTLEEDFLGAELTVTNKRSSNLQLVGAVISHFKVSTPDATYAVGLQGSNYVTKQPLRSVFSIIPPDFYRENASAKVSLGQKGFEGLFSGWGRSNQNEEDRTEGEEKDTSIQLTEKMSRVYTYAPRKFTLIDRGRRNSVVVERVGFDEFYFFSPGSDHEWYGQNAYVCIGPSAVLLPVTIDPQSVWRGGQCLYNPNM